MLRMRLSVLLTDCFMAIARANDSGADRKEAPYGMPWTPSRLPGRPHLLYPVFFPHCLQALGDILQRSLKRADVISVQHRTRPYPLSHRLSSPVERGALGKAASAYELVEVSCQARLC